MLSKPPLHFAYISSEKDWHMIMFNSTIIARAKKLQRDQLGPRHNLKFPNFITWNFPTFLVFSDLWYDGPCFHSNMDKYAILRFSIGLQCHARNFCKVWSVTIWFVGSTQSEDIFRFESTELDCFYGATKDWLETMMAIYLRKGKRKTMLLSIPSYDPTKNNNNTWTTILSYNSNP